MHLSKYNLVFLENSKQIIIHYVQKYKSKQIILIFLDFPLEDHSKVLIFLSLFMIILI